MAIRVECQNPACKKRFQVKDESAGKRFKCPTCGQVIAVPLVVESSSAPASTAPVTVSSFAGVENKDGQVSNVGPQSASKPETAVGMFDYFRLALLRLQCLFSSQQRFNVAVSLREACDEKSTRLLLHLLTDQDGKVRAAAAESLATPRSSEAIDGLLSHLHDPETLVQFSVLESLKKQGDSRVASALIELLRAENPTLRVRVLQAVGNWTSAEHPDVLRAMATALSDESGAVVKTAAVILSSDRAPECRGHLLTSLQNPENKHRTLIAQTLSCASWQPQSFAERMALADAGGKLPELWMALAAEGTSGADQLTQILSSQEETHVAGAARALAKTPTPKAVPRLVDALTIFTTDEDVIRPVAEALSACVQVSPVAVCGQLLSHPIPTVRTAAALALGKKDEPAAIVALLQLLLQEPHTLDAAERTRLVVKSTRATAVLKLVLADRATRMDKLLTLLPGSDYAFLSAVCRVFADAGATQAIGPLFSLIEAVEEHPAKRDIANALKTLAGICQASEFAVAAASPCSEVRAIAAESLAQTSDLPVAARQLVKLLKDECVAVRRAATCSLSSMSTQGAAAGLQQAVSDADAEVRRMALTALIANNQCPEASVLLNLSRDDDAQVRVIAARALSGLSVPQATQRMRELLSDSSSVVRHIAANSVNALGTTNDLNALKALARDTDEELRRFSLDAICRSAGPMDIVLLQGFKRDPSPKLRNLMIKVFATSFPAASVETISELLNDLEVRDEAMRALRSLRTSGYGDASKVLWRDSSRRKECITCARAVGVLDIDRECSRCGAWFCAECLGDGTLEKELEHMECGGAIKPIWSLRDYNAEGKRNMANAIALSLAFMEKGMERDARKAYDKSVDCLPVIFLIAQRHQAYGDKVVSEAVVVRIRSLSKYRDALNRLVVAFDLFDVLAASMPREQARAVGDLRAIIRVLWREV